MQNIYDFSHLLNLSEPSCVEKLNCFLNVFKRYSRNTNLIDIGNLRIRRSSFQTNDYSIQEQSSLKKRGGKISEACARAIYNNKDREKELEINHGHKRIRVDSLNEEFNNNNENDQNELDYLSICDLLCSCDKHHPNNHKTNNDNKRSNNNNNRKNNNNKNSDISDITSKNNSKTCICKLQNVELVQNGMIEDAE
eukprot:Pgem_evm1s3974